jgi:hypothetical protein
MILVPRRVQPIDRLVDTIKSMEARGATVEAIRANLPGAIRMARFSANVEERGKKTIVKFDGEERVIVFEMGRWSVRANARSSSRPSKRILLWTVPAVAIAMLGYVGWALAGAVHVAETLRDADATTVMTVVDAQALRHSLADQLTQAVMRRNAAFSGVNGISRSLAGGVAESVVDSRLTDVLKPENIVALLKSENNFAGSVTHVDNATKLPELSDALRANWLKILLSVSFDGPTSFAVSIDRGAQIYTAHFHLQGTVWRLSGIDLPKNIIDALAQKAQGQMKDMAD